LTFPIIIPPKITAKSNWLVSQVVWNFVTPERDEMEKQEGNTLRDVLASLLFLKYCFTVV